jgi:hypothetical protein
MGFARPGEDAAELSEAVEHRVIEILILRILLVVVLLLNALALS